MSTVSQRHSVLALSQSPLRHAGMDRVGIGYALIDNCSYGEACAAIIAHAKSGGRPAFAATANAQHVVLLDKDRRLREIYDRADLVVADGTSLLLAARLYGRFLQERVTGIDLFQMLCGLAAENNLHVFLLGGRPGSADLSAIELKKRFPILRISTHCPPYGFEKDTAILEETARTVRAAEPDLLFVALGAPKQEYWIYECGLQLSVPVCIGVGGSFEMLAGIVHRAPVWIQRANCEWLYRLFREPRRLWRRYLIGNLKFAAIVIRQGIRRIFLDIFFTLVERELFGAELREPTMQYKRELVMNLLHSEEEAMNKTYHSDALAS
jgi:N-acetylglucosaminyldiphosphoundecaprenol N-acetyl-beta-D-mannosaminyltransferase